MPRGEQIALIFFAAVFIIALARFFWGTVSLPQATDKTIFAEGTVGHIATVNPLFVDFNDADRDLAALVFSGLMRYDPQKRNFLPDLATKWQRLNGGRTYELELRTDAKWHDQRPVTIDDVIFTFATVIQDPSFRNPVIKNTFAGVEVKKTGTSSVIFNLPESNSYFISALTTGLIPKHLLQDIPVPSLQKSNFGKHPIGSGPYKLTSMNLDNDGDFIDLEAFPEYYGTQPTIKKIRFFTFPDEEELQDEQDTLHALSRLHASLEDERLVSYPYTLNQFSALYFNAANPLLKDKRVRGALARGLDKNLLLQPGETRVDTLTLENKSSSPEFSYSPGSSSQLLTELHITDKEKPVRFTLLAHESIASAVAQTIQEQFEKLGVFIDIETVDTEEFSKRIAKRQYDMVLMRQNLGYNRDVYPLFHSSQGGASEFPGINFSNFKSFKTDSLTEALRRERDPASKEKLLIELTKTITDETPLIFISTPVYSYALDRRVSAFPEAHLDYHSDRLSITPYLSFND